MRYISEMKKLKPIVLLLNNANAERRDISLSAIELNTNTSHYFYLESITAGIDIHNVANVVAYNPDALTVFTPKKPNKRMYSI